MADGSLYVWWCRALACALALVAVDGLLVDIAYVETAVAKGAVQFSSAHPICWKGGGWCNNVTSCLQRKRTRLGSSKEMATQIAFSGILSDTPDYNPDQMITSYGCQDLDSVTQFYD
ncbi:uncharacterized protein C2845_PM12G24460 [Panicum miliaceum]|uniref:Pectin acetylesterase n=1 Tax=Panicum miliaceum TaxID=4540 RepID=A0A3L6QG21_PANMI|nr:uncharacterized protein C2845_PM12G24460 [Panicum miliaceum]